MTQKPRFDLLPPTELAQLATVVRTNLQRGVYTHLSEVARARRSLEAITAELKRQEGP